jgi:hypothetical protein
MNGQADYSTSAGGASNQFNSTSYPSHARKKSITNNTGNTGNFGNTTMNGSMNIGNFTGNGSMNGGSGNHTAISGGRKPTADSHAYTLYKPNKANARGKFSNGGGSISGQGDASFDAGYGSIQNNSIIMMDK